MKKLFTILLTAALLVSMTACGGETKKEATEEIKVTGEEAKEEVEVIVFAAASMTETLTELAEKYKVVAPNVKLIFNFDSSGTLKS